MKKGNLINTCPESPPGRFLSSCLPLLLLVVLAGCQDGLPERPPPSDDPVDEPEPKRVEGVDYFLPHIDLSHWKVTLPITDPNGKLLEVEPPKILEYATDETLLPYMYNDSTDGSLVFYAFPASTTPNSSYSRTELREQMVPGSNSTNWTFDQGGSMKGSLRVAEVTTDNNGNYHRMMVMQIHGRLTNEQRDLIGEDDNNAPPVLKIYWERGKVRVITKVLKDSNTSFPEILETNAWTDDDSHYFEEEVGFDPFTLEVIASSGRIQVTLNNDETKVYESEHLEKWGVFENYFKAGNYFQTRDEGAFSRVKYYDLVVTHP